MLPIRAARIHAIRVLGQEMWGLPFVHGKLTGGGGRRKGGGREGEGRGKGGGREGEGRRWREDWVAFAVWLRAPGLPAGEARRLPSARGGRGGGGGAQLSLLILTSDLEADKIEPRPYLIIPC